MSAARPPIEPPERERRSLRRVPPETDARPVDLSILVVTWNSERWIERCLRAIPAACEGVAAEVVVYDNASSDATLQCVAQTILSVPGGNSGLSAPSGQEAAQTGLSVPHVIRSAVNDGFAAGTNRALEASSGRYVFLLNPDCELAPRALTRLVEFLDAHAEAAAAAPLLSDEDGEEQREFQLRRLPTVRSLMSEVLLIDKLFPRSRAMAHHRYRDLELSEPKRIEQPAAAALLIRRDVLAEVGPLDEQFSPAWFEDVDYCRRLAEAGREIWVVPAAQARHFGGASLEHMSFVSFLELWYRNMWRYARKWLPAGQAEALRWAIIAGMFLRCGAALVGFGHRTVGRWQAVRAYVHVMEKAFHRWSPR